MPLPEIIHIELIRILTIIPFTANMFITHSIIE